LRRSAIGLIRTILENNKEFKIRDLINYSCLLYNEQNFKFDSKKVQNDLAEFLTDRLKNFMKEKGIRKDIYESAISSYSIDNLLNVYKKAYAFNKLISKEIGKDVIFIYKRASNILSNELKNNEFEISGLADTGLFKNEFEKNLYKKIQNIRKDLTNIAKENDFTNILKTLSSAKKEVNEFFDNVIVNDEEKSIKKNRLELLQMLCKTFDNYFNFSKVESGT